MFNCKKIKIAMIRLRSPQKWKNRVDRLIFASICFGLAINTVGAARSNVQPKSAAVVAASSLETSHQEINLLADSPVKIIKVGVMSITEVEQTQQKWQPTIDYLSDTIPGYRFQFVPLKFDNIEQLIINKEVDFVLVNPGMYVELEWEHGVRRIATLKNLRLGKPYTQFGAVIFRRRDRHDLKELSDLKGKKFMAVSEIAFGGWQIARETLAKSDVKPQHFQELKFSGSHDKVVYAVQNVDVDAGTVRTDTLERMAQAGKIKLDDFVVLNLQEYGAEFPFASSTKLYPEWPFAMMPHTKPRLAEQVTVALIEMQPEAEAAKSGMYQGWTIPANYQPVHDTLRYLRIRPYEDWGKISWQQVIYLYRYWLGFASTAIFLLTYGAVYIIQRRRNEAMLLQTQSELKLRVKELAQAKQKAEIASEAKSSFLSNMSHELRTPLNGILGYAQILRRDRSLTSHQSKGLRIIYESGNHLLTLISDLLDLAKIEARRLELNPSDLHLQSFLAGIEGVIKMRAMAKDISFQLQINSDLPSGIIADEKRLRQILLNLLSNAVKFTDRGRVVLNISTVAVENLAPDCDRNSSLNQQIRFEVTDTGVGIDSRQLVRVFQSFEQVGAKKRRHEGTGLGLAISQQLVELMGGKLQVKSELSQGSTFWFEIVVPSVKMTANSLTALQQRQIVGYEGRKKHILVIDDKEENCLVLQHMLEPLGFKISLAENGQQGIDLFRQLQPDCVLTDLVMPVKTGFEAVQEIRQLPKTENTPIIAVSASVLEDPTKVRALGFDLFLPKPVDEAELLNTLQKCLKLNWIYEAIDRSPPKSDSTSSISTPSFIAPPAKDLETLYELAMLGNMSKIYQWATAIEELDARYQPLAQQLKKLSQDFQEKAIVSLVEEHLSKQKNKL